MRDPETQMPPQESRNPPIPIPKRKYTMPWRTLDISCPTGRRSGGKAEERTCTWAAASVIAEVGASVGKKGLGGAENKPR